MSRLVQIRNGLARRVAVVDEPQLRMLSGVDSVYALAREALAQGRRFDDLVQERTGQEVLLYDEGVLRRVAVAAAPTDRSPRRADALPGLRHGAHAHGQRSRSPGHAHHRAGGSHRQHADVSLGAQGGLPSPGASARPPSGSTRARARSCAPTASRSLVPSYAEDGGEEAEVAGVYVVDSEGRPRRLGMAVGNEFSDHRFERKNYLNLAGSKLRTCSLGPELAVDPGFDSVSGRVSLERAGSVLWSKEIRSGEAEDVP